LRRFSPTNITFVSGALELSKHFITKKAAGNRKRVVGRGSDVITTTGRKTKIGALAGRFPSNVHNKPKDGAIYRSIAVELSATIWV
jgi:hypothetical protein